MTSTTDILEDKLGEILTEFGCECIEYMGDRYVKIKTDKGYPQLPKVKNYKQEILKHYIPKSSLKLAIERAKPEEITADKIYEKIKGGALLDKQFVDTHDAVAIAVGHKISSDQYHKNLLRELGIGK